MKASLYLWVSGLYPQLFVVLQGVPEPKSLEERLLSVEISETSVDVIKTVIEEVASIATVVSFLPLANRVQKHKHLLFSHSSVDRTAMSVYLQVLKSLKKALNLLVSLKKKKRP